ncbi:MAG: hypothetical protein P4L72_16965 [Parvibaculum sp.]|uniref:hypothetical protein n=1 Tax=Parvibaculum sp. TaxID=2024848 RepID=UPI00283ED13A|nr:hypothetical protein [Parvibaculum sp.]MDR3500907.1 hypothetical protein [Parvibaculum sp.]
MSKKWKRLKPATPEKHKRLIARSIRLAKEEVLWDEMLSLQLASGTPTASIIKAPAPPARRLRLATPKAKSKSLKLVMDRGLLEQVCRNRQG